VDANRVVACARYIRSWRLEVVNDEKNLIELSFYNCQA
jgi:hypothetical protein